MAGIDDNRETGISSDITVCLLWVITQILSIKKNVYLCVFKKKMIIITCSQMSHLVQFWQETAFTMFDLLLENQFFHIQNPAVTKNPLLSCVFLQGKTPFLPAAITLEHSAPHQE